MAETYEALYARISRFETALRLLGWEHGFYVGRVQIDDNRRDLGLEITVDFVATNDNRAAEVGAGILPPKEGAK